jgi:hypothetical protein
MAWGIIGILGVVVLLLIKIYPQALRENRDLANLTMFGPNRSLSSFYSNMRVILSDLLLFGCVAAFTVWLIIEAAILLT